MILGHLNNSCFRTAGVIVYSKLKLAIKAIYLKNFKFLLAIPLKLDYLAPTYYE